jgi:tRNA-dihydrouridine synthase A
VTTEAIDPSRIAQTSQPPQGLVDRDEGPLPVLSVAPMMQRTDRHFRYFMRLLTRHTLLYTEMVVAKAIVHGDAERLLAFNEAEHPVALQVGGDDPETMAEAARAGEAAGYDEININVGCPSSRVQDGNFGVCLMGEAKRVAQLVESMRDACDLPVTVKHRIGFDDRDSYEEMADFVETVSGAGCTHFTVHARKAWLDGLSPKDNRNVPPIRYEDVYRLKDEFPSLTIELNGHIETLDDIESHLQQVDACMIGRAAYERPYRFAEADEQLFGDEHPVPSRPEVARKMADYAEDWMARGGKLQAVTKHIINLYSHRRGAGVWRRYLSEHDHLDESGPEIIVEAMRRAEEA